MNLLEKYLEDNISDDNPALEEIRKALREYVYLSSTITDKEKIEMYERFMEDLNDAINEPSSLEHLILLENLNNWCESRDVQIALGFEKQKIEQTKAFLNLRKL